LNPYRVEFDLRAVRDGAKLSVSVRRRIREKLEFLRAAPFRSHPGVSVKEAGDLRGVWRFHVASDVRVFYTVVGDVLWVIMVEKSAGVTKKTARELRRRL
jgi:mRNA-degrading endonuclease RelE of RelBE toxin-antitoxin system